MTTLLTSIGEFFEKAIEWMGEILTVVMGNPALLVMVIGFSVVGFVFGILGRLIRI